MSKDSLYLIGVDGGGSGTRIKIISPHGKSVEVKSDFPSALNLGILNSWESILKTVEVGFQNLNIPLDLSKIKISIGISGANNEKWKAEFAAANPGFNLVKIFTDGYTTLIGAHDNKPGTIVAIGTGSVGMSINQFKNIKIVSGWGFPTGDEASGAWLGMKACTLTEKMIDGRMKKTPLSSAVFNKFNNSIDDFMCWLGSVTPSQFASLAPMVLSYATIDPIAGQWICDASKEVEEMCIALDEKLQLPICICGGLGEKLVPFLSEKIRNKNIKPIGSSVDGAIKLLQYE